MRNPDYSSVDPKTGNVAYNGPLEIMKGTHNHMPSRTSAYLPGDPGNPKDVGDIRFHVNASSLGGTNGRSNVVPGHNDVDKGAWSSIENGERAALQNGVSIMSEKTAIVDSQPGDRPNTFTVTDNVTFADGHKETIHHSFTNESYATQENWNNVSAALPGNFDATNPGDGLRDTMNTASYADLMIATDAELPNLDNEYVASDFSGLPDSVMESDTIYTDSTQTGVDESDMGSNENVSIEEVEADSSLDLV